MKINLNSYKLIYTLNHKKVQALSKGIGSRNGEKANIIRGSKANEITTLAASTKVARSLPH